MSALETPAASLLEAVAPPERRGVARDEVRMLVTERGSGSHSHARFVDLPNVLHSGDVLVVNDSATLPAALAARRENGDPVSLHVATMIDPRLWIAEPRGAARGGEQLRLPGDALAVLIAPLDPEYPRLWYTRFELPDPMYAYLGKYGAPIRYRYVKDAFPLSDYQTIFARVPGSSEMPSAARPFTGRVVRRLLERGVEIVTVTLHCGVSSVEAPERPCIERYTVSPESAFAIESARREGRRIIAVGTTALRAIETAANASKLRASSGWTDLVVEPGYRPKAADGLLTGFHDAGATHQWILRAFVNPQVLASAYSQAAGSGYRQHEFGDVHLLL